MSGERFVAVLIGMAVGFLIFYVLPFPANAITVGCVVVALLSIARLRGT